MRCEEGGILKLKCKCVSTIISQIREGDDFYRAIARGSPITCQAQSCLQFHIVPFRLKPQKKLSLDSSILSATLLPKSQA